MLNTTFGSFMATLVVSFLHCSTGIFDGELLAQCAPRDCALSLESTTFCFLLLPCMNLWYLTLFSPIICLGLCSWRLGDVVESCMRRLCKRQELSSRLLKAVVFYTRFRGDVHLSGRLFLTLVWLMNHWQKIVCMVSWKWSMARTRECDRSWHCEMHWRPWCCDGFIFLPNTIKSSLQHYTWRLWNGLAMKRRQLAEQRALAILLLCCSDSELRRVIRHFHTVLMV